MAGGAFADGSTLKRAHLYEHKITGYLIFSCIIGALGGALFGYDLGVSGEFNLIVNLLIIKNKPKQILILPFIGIGNHFQRETEKFI